MTEKRNKITFILDRSSQIFKANLESLSSFAKESVESIAKKNEAFIKEIEERDFKQHPFPDNYFSLKSADLANIDWLLLNSIFIACYSYFEHHLFSLASIVEDRIPDKIKIKDINGRGIHQYRKYLHLIGKLTSAEKNSDWQDVDLFQNVRNKLAHNGGLIITDPSKAKNLEKEEVFKFLSRFDVIMAGALGRIRIRNTVFIESFNKLASELSDKLVNEIRDKYPSENGS